MGSRSLKDHVPDRNALREAGAVVFGKNNMLEFAYGFVHPDYGQCNNPWDTGRTAGGSSSGSASSVCVGIGYASIGTDTGGSIRVPASFCGIVGLKPTYERVSREGCFPLSHTLDHVGPTTRTVPYTATETDPDFEGGALEYIPRTVPFNITGHPALTIPAGNTGSQNLPVGVELVSAHGNEDTLYAVAPAYEDSVGGFARPPI